MPLFRYAGAEPRHYPDAGIGEVRPGDERDLPELPADGRWEPKKTAPKVKPEPEEK